MPLEQLYSVQQVAEQTGLSTWTVRRAIKGGMLRAVQTGPGCAVRIPASAVPEWLTRAYPCSPAPTDANP